MFVSKKLAHIGKQGVSSVEARRLVIGRKGLFRIFFLTFCSEPTGFFEEASAGSPGSN